MTKTKMTDQKVLEGLLAKRPDTYRYLYKKFGPMVLAHVLKNSGSREDGDEILQRTVLKVWEKVKAGKYQDQGKFDRFFYSVATNMWLDELRSRRRKPVSRLGKTEEYLQDESEEDWSRKVVKHDSLDAIYRALKKLGDTCKELIELYHFQEIPLKEIAELKQYDYGNLRKRIFDCRNRLKRFATEELNLSHTLNV